MRPFWFRGDECVRFHSLLYVGVIVRGGSFVVEPVIGGGSLVLFIGFLVGLVRVWLFICVCLLDGHSICGWDGVLCNVPFTLVVPEYPDCGCRLALPLGVVVSVDS